MPSENLLALISSAELVEVVAFELSAKRHDSISDEKIPEQVQVQPKYNLQTATKPNDSGFIVRLSVELELPTGVILCEVGASYNLKTSLGFPLDANMLVDYSNEVAVMALLPFARQHIADLSQRVLGFPLLMPVMLRGAVHFTLNQEEAKKAD